MGWMNSDTRRLKDKIKEFSSVSKYKITPQALIHAIDDIGTACLLGEANGEYFLKDCALEASKKNSKVFVPFKIRECRYLDAFIEAGMLTKVEKDYVMFTAPGIAWLCHKYRL